MKSKKQSVNRRCSSLFSGCLDYWLIRLTNLRTLETKVYFHLKDMMVQGTYSLGIIYCNISFNLCTSRIIATSASAEFLSDDYPSFSVAHVRERLSLENPVAEYFVNQ